MKCFILLFNLIIISGSTVLNAQNQVYGKLQDSQQQPIDFGEVRLTLKGSEDPIQTYSDTLGYFVFNQLPTGLYTFQVLHWGNLEHEQELYIDTNMDLGLFSLNSSSQLSEIVIEGKKKVFETKIDRTVFNVENSIIASGGDALEAIKATPGIIVTNDDIKIIGKTSISVMIDDKIVQLSGEDLNNYLKTLSADNIQKIEVITTPPAKYDAQGNSGLLNIVLKTKRENAWNNSVRLNYFQATDAYYKFGDTFTYAKDKFSAQASIDLTKGKTRGIERLNNYFADETWVAEDLAKNEMDNLSAKIAMDYQISPKSRLGAQYMHGIYKNTSIEDITNTNLYDANQQPFSHILTTGGADRKDLFDNLNFNYEYKMDTLGKKLTTNLDYFDSNKNNYRPFESEQIFFPNTTPSSSMKATSSSKMDIKIYSAKVDFEHPTKFAKLEYGAKANFITNASDSRYYDRITGTTVEDITKSDQFNYKENTQSLYVSGSKEWNSKWTSQFGLRMEATQTQGNSIAMNRTDKRDFIDFFPTAYLQYKPNDDHAININYSKRINRQSFWELNPFRWYVDAYSYSEGNPFLKPYNTHNAELSYSYKTNWVTKIAFSKTLNGSTQIQNIDEETKLRTFTRENFYDLEAYSISQTYTFSKYNWWQSVNVLTAMYAKTSNIDPSKSMHNMLNDSGFYFSTNNSFKINTNLSMELNGYFSSKTSYLVYQIDPQADVSFGASYKMMDGNLRWNLNVSDIFKTSESKLYTSTTTTKTMINNRNQTRELRIGVTYNFGNKNIKSKNTTTGNEEERNRS
ncbi:outer membrane beta-barrel family protein [Flavobacterium sp. NKUCC04_CG]|uniref:outer membrane beta-barrel family protein n=1 Tax=Flavobacterium sp. NKUCC04_CG TaxID=2842121 RepID=UPI001C5B3188|nr:outer membrane beta-barrel family protein [Flavobacterium sp. NKUCC04_CG]MBW3518311.1 TonB-dependent receptor family protein [Flavobacterium sp. NKUCC04_CG]